MATPAELKEKVRRAWSTVGAPPSEDMRSLGWSSGDAAIKTFMGVDPVDVDIESSGFQGATPLLDLPDRAAAAYLGPYLISLLDGLILQEAVGFPVDISTRVHTITVMMAPNFWSYVAGPNLSPECQEVVGEIAALVVANRDALALADDHVARFERLIRSVRRELDHRDD